MKKSELRQIIREEIQKLNGDNINEITNEMLAAGVIFTAVSAIS